MPRGLVPWVVVNRLRCGPLAAWANAWLDGTAGNGGAGDTVAFDDVLVAASAIARAPALAMATPYSSRFGKKRAAMTLWIASTLTYWLPMAFRLLGIFPENGTPWLIPLLIVFGTSGTMLSIACQITISSMIARWA